MKNRMIDWIKKNKLVTLIIIILILFIAKDLFSDSVLRLTPWSQTSLEPISKSAVTEEALTSSVGRGGIGIIPSTDYTPTETEDRLVVQESNLSLVVMDVRETSDQIVDQAKSVGGYMVNTSLTNPEEAPFATVTVRVPADKLREVLDDFRGLAVKVTSENIRGTDVTDEYVDLESRLETLGKTKTKFEEILNKATEIQDILEVQRQLTYLQDQIDSLKGRQEYLEQTAKLAKVTVYLSTDEYALPYKPTETFRPKVVFKLAVRSLVNVLRSFAKTLIWIGVYAVIWVPVGAIVFFVWQWWKKRTS
jgi:hypothetical protein